MDDPIIQRIERFRCSRGTLFVERRNRGYTLYSAHSGASIDDALRFIAHEDIFWVMT
jgi:hypothetical protein